MRTARRAVGGPVAGFGSGTGEYTSGMKNAAVGRVEADGVDLAAAGRWEDVEERLLRAACPAGAALRLGPGERFEVLQELPQGLVVTAPPAPEYAKVPGWVCVEVEMFHGRSVHGWVDETLVEEIRI